MSEHTPGPWTAEQRTLHCLDLDSPTESASDPIDGDGWHIVGPPLGGMVDDGLNGYFANEADAHLVAAAPELLAALERISKWTGSLGQGDDIEIYYCEYCRENHADYGRIEHRPSCPTHMVRSAITKARGEVPG